MRTVHQRMPGLWFINKKRELTQFQCQNPKKKRLKNQSNLKQLKGNSHPLRCGFTFFSYSTDR
ncbi:hypothetical protein C4A76_21175 [Brevibacillus laterosporus]|nr:hypothetical protein C4A76_21175 [Brevibacillus laterosporus]